MKLVEKAGVDPVRKLNRECVSLLCTTVLLIFTGMSPLSAQTELSTGRSDLFSGSGNCALCHQSNGTANTSSRGEDISQPTTWRSTMMANAARDPYWQAVVESESLDLPALAAVIQDKCTNCHNPMGHEQAHRDGAQYYSLQDALSNGLAMDAVSCTLCHQITEDNFGTKQSFSGGYAISDTRVTYGPYTDPVKQPMSNISGFEPLYGAHVDRADLCATCHTLFTPYVDDQGKVAGEFPEQTPFLEWRVSSYEAEDRTCQSCHMPDAGEGTTLSTIPMHLVTREPFYRHNFVGGNTTMVEMLKAHGSELGVTADMVHFDSTISRTATQLQRTAADLRATAEIVATELRLDVTVENLTGHKFPTGYPGRRAWLHVRILNRNSESVFESGQWDSDGRIVDLDPGYEPHYGEITEQSQVQIYETVLADVNDDVTYSLLRAARYIKDNRIPPKGFPEQSYTSDTIGVVGAARSDTDFGRSAGLAGSGADALRYRVKVNTAEAPFSITVELCYQSIRPAFVHHLRRHDEQKINRFLAYYDSSDRRPFIMRTLQMSTNVTSSGKLSGDGQSLRIGRSFPNPWSSGSGNGMYIPVFTEKGNETLVLEVSTPLGKTVFVKEVSLYRKGRNLLRFNPKSLAPGMYLYRLGVESFIRAGILVIGP